MFAQTVSMCGMMACVRQLSFGGFEGPQLVFFRAAAGLIFLTPWLIQTVCREPEILVPGEWRYLLLRGGIGLLGVLGWFIALTGLTISDVVAIQFTYPLFVVIGAAIVLGERVDARRWTALAIGFGGALIVIRPGVIPFEPLVLCVLISAVSNATVQLMTKYFSLRVRGSVMIFYMNAVMACGALFISWSSWVWPDWSHMIWILAMGALGTVAHIFLARGMTFADASILGPVDFLRLPIAAALGWVLFGEVSDIWVWLGATVILFAIIMISRRQA
jgi:drug/metabolite transporter (DMT)-like permease